jgi:hypothetical protein
MIEWIALAWIIKWLHDKTPVYMSKQEYDRIANQRLLK